MIAFPCKECLERKRIIAEARAQGKSWTEIIRAIAEYTIAQRAKRAEDPPKD